MGEGSIMVKDMFYRMKNSPSVCWRMLLWYLVMMCWDGKSSILLDFSLHRDGDELGMALRMFL